MASAQTSKEIRHELDFYPTPEWYTRALNRYMPFEFGESVLCPFAGNGDIMIKSILALSLITLSPQVAYAQVSSAAASSGNGQATSSAGSLTGLGVVNESNTENTSTQNGSVINQGINNSSSFSVPSFSGIRDLRCEQPTFEASVFGTRSFSTSGGMVASFRIPLGNQAHFNCLEMSQIYTEQATYELYIYTVNFCLANPSLNLQGAPAYIQETCSSLLEGNHDEL